MLARAKDTVFWPGILLTWRQSELGVGSAMSSNLPSRPTQSSFAGSQIGRHILNLGGTFDQRDGCVSPLMMQLKGNRYVKIYVSLLV